MCKWMKMCKLVMMCKWLMICEGLMVCECGEVFQTRSEITIISGINIKLTTNFWGS